MYFVIFLLSNLFIVGSFVNTPITLSYFKDFNKKTLSLNEYKL